MRIRVVFHNLLNTLWHILAFSIIVIGFSISLARITIDNLNQYRPDVERWLSTQTGMAVQTKGLQFGWRRHGPSLLLKNARIRDANGKFDISVGRGFVVLDLFKSLWTRRLVARQIEFQNVQIRIKDHIRNDGTQQFSSSQAFAWLLEQGNIQIYDAYVLFDHAGRKSTLATSALYYHGGKHRKAFKTRLVLTDGGWLDLRALSQGDLVQHGQFYIKANDIAFDKLPTPLVSNLTDHIQGHITGQLWGQWQARQLVRLTAKLSATELGLKNQTPIDIRPFWLHWKRDGNTRWALATTPITMSWQQKTLTPFAINAWSWKTDNTIHRHIAGLQAPLSLVVQWLTPWLPEEFAQKIKASPIQGALTQLSVHTTQLSDKPRWRGAFRIEKLTVPDTIAGVGINGVSMQGAFTPDQLHLDVTGDNSTISIPPLFANKLHASKLSARVDLRKIGRKWLLQWPHIKFVNPNMTLFSRGVFIQKPSPYLQASVAIEKLDLKTLARILPTKVMSKKLVAYLTDSIKSGHLTSAVGVFRGPVDAFPFSNGAGIFDTYGQLRDVVMRFNPEWPEIRSLDSDIAFTNAQMRIGPATGKLQSVQVKNLTAQIHDLTLEDPILQIRAKSEHSLADALSLLKMSPIQEVPEKLRPLKLAGSATTQLSLTIPLAPIPNTIKGLIQLHDVALELPTAQKSQVKMLHGTLGFDMDGITQGALTGQWLDAPVNLQLKQNNDKFIANFATKLTPKIIATITGNPFLAGQLSGQSRTTGTIEFSSSSGGDQIQVQAVSDLKGLATNIPVPFSKSANETWPFKIHFIQSNEHAELVGVIEEKLHTKLSFSPDGQVTGVVKIGTTAGTQKAKTLAIYAGLTTLPLDQWLRFVWQSPTANTGLPKNPVDLQLDAQHLQFDGHDFGNLQASGHFDSTSKLWKLSVRNRIADGIVTIPSVQAPITVHLSQLHIPKELFSTTETPSTVQEIPQLPPLSIKIDQLAVDQTPLGAWTLKFKTIAPRMIRGDISGTLPIGDAISARSYWNPAGSTVYLQWFSPKAHNTLKLIGIPPGVRAEKAKLKISAHWPAAPWSLKPKSVQLTGKLSTAAGRIEEVSDRAARIFSVFSLQSLKRRLTLDFSDIFSKGFFFDDIQASFFLDQGRLYSPQFKINGTAADVSINGTTDLIAGTTDQRVTVIPKLTSSLPILTGWAVSPSAAVVAYILDKLFIRPALDVVTRIDYRVFGPIESPEIKEIGKEKARLKVDDNNDN